MESQFDDFDLKNKEKKANFGKKNVAGLIDAAIYSGIYLLFFAFLPREIWDSILTEYALLFILATFMMYRIISILILGKTLGMQLLKLEFSKENDNSFSVLEKILAAFMIYSNGIDCFEINKK